MGDGDSDRYPCPYLNINCHRDTCANRHANPNCHANSHRNCDTVGNAVTHIDGVEYINGYADSTTNSYGDCNGNLYICAAYPNSHINGNQYANGDGYIHGDNDGNPYAATDSYSNKYTCADCDTNANLYRNACVHSHDTQFTDAERHQYSV